MKRDHGVVVGEKRLRLKYKNVIFEMTALEKEDEKAEEKKPSKEHGPIDIVSHFKDYMLLTREDPLPLVFLI